MPAMPKPPDLEMEAMRGMPQTFLAPRTTRYKATDDDLPEAMWEENRARLDREKTEAEHQAQGELEARLRYAVPSAPLRSEERDRTKRSPKCSLLERRKYIKWPKKAQLWGWLRDFAATGAIARMNEREADFCLKLLKRFERYHRKTKWITLPQYEFGLVLAGRYLAWDRRRNLENLSSGNTGNQNRSKR